MKQRVSPYVREYTRAALRVFEPSTPDERERRREHVFALLLVATIAAVKYVSGSTLDRVPFTFYVLAVAASALRGGMAPAIVATLASLLVAAFGAPAPAATHARVVFTVEALGVAALVSFGRARWRGAEARLASAEASIARLQVRDRHGRLLDAALRHLEDTAAETAVVVLNDAGMVTEWRGSAERLYGYSADQALGTNAGALLLEGASRRDLGTLLREARERGWAGGADVHRRVDGTRVHVEFEVRMFRDLDMHGYTLSVHDVARRREWDAYREAAVRAQAALQKAADDTRQQLAALESVIDPSLNPLEGPGAVAELLERLRTTVDADGAALVEGGRMAARATAPGGLQPDERVRPPRRDGQPLTPGRVTLIHNDRDRVAQATALLWPVDVASLMVVPVVHNGQVWSTIEVVSERAKRATDWDVALMRITADRLAAVVVQDQAIAVRAS